MKLHLNSSGSIHTFTGYGRDFVEVNGRRVEHSLILTAERMIEDWPLAAWSELTATHFERLRALAPSIVLLGTGARQRFPHPSLTRALIDAQIGLEVMDTAAACRTFNILVGEGRNVAAGIFIESASG